uniref:Uncharacterized protein n=1 Tax=Rhizophora mucronata TaxID=61149 RepID=A0A2P2PNN9_RHIMU
MCAQKLICPAVDIRLSLVLFNLPAKTNRTTSAW